MAAAVDSARLPVYHGGGGYQQARTTMDHHHHHHSPPPPIPARLHHHVTRDPAPPPRPATALGQGDLVDAGYLAPVAVRPTAAGGLLHVLPAGGPPLPPRQPLRRSVSLTHRAPPQQPAAAPLSDLRHHATHDDNTPPAAAGREPTLDDVLASLRRSRVDSLHPAPLSPALSAPLLGQVSSSYSDCLRINCYKLY